MKKALFLLALLTLSTSSYAIYEKHGQPRFVCKDAAECEEGDLFDVNLKYFNQVYHCHLETIKVIELPQGLPSKILCRFNKESFRVLKYRNKGK